MYLKLTGESSCDAQRREEALRALGRFAAGSLGFHSHAHGVLTGYGMALLTLGVITEDERLRSMDWYNAASRLVLIGGNHE